MKFSTIARVVVALDAIAMPIVAILRFAHAPTLALYCGFMFIPIGVIEIPFICSCFKFCIAMRRFTGVITRYWLFRSLFYIGIAAGGFALFTVNIQTKLGDSDNKDTYLLLTIIAILIGALLFMIAAFRKEPNAEALEHAVKQEESAEKTSIFGGLFGKGKGSDAKSSSLKEEVVKAAAPSIAQQMFGGLTSGFGGSASTAKAPTPAGFYGEDDNGPGSKYTPPDVAIAVAPPKMSDTPDFSKSNKYGGYGTGFEAGEDNPFLS